MMNEPLWRDGPWDLLVDLKRLVADRAPVEVELNAALAARRKALEKSYRAAVEQLQAKFEEEKTAAEAERAAAVEKIHSEHESDMTAAVRTFENAGREITARAQSEELAARDKLQEGRWHAGTLFEGSKSNLASRLNEIQAHVDKHWGDFEAVQNDAVRILRRRWIRKPYPEPAGSSRTTFDDPLQYFNDSYPAARNVLYRLSEQGLPTCFEGLRPLWFFLIFWAVAIGPWMWLYGWQEWMWWLPLGAGSALLLCILLWRILFRFSKRQSMEVYLVLRQVMVDADYARRAAIEAVKQNFDKKVAGMAEMRQGETRSAEEIFRANAAEINGRRDDELRHLKRRHEAKIAELNRARDKTLRELEERHAARLSDMAARRQADSERLARKYERRVAEIEQQHRQQWDAMANRWHTGFERFATEAQSLDRTARQLFPDWNAPEWSNWTPPASIPSAIPLGRCDVRLGQIENGIPQDERLRPATTDFTLPAIFPSRDRSLLLLKAAGDGLVQAIGAVQTAMLRMLTSIPPGKVRFMIVDPVGLGENFSAFMHLTDYNDQLVSSRIWTDQSHIEQRLSELTGHMENVIQVYLRNEFRAIDEYNKFAGDLAEPYRILVVANFPVGFSETAAARLASIVASGARCGVYTIMSVDTRLRMPRDFHLADLERSAMILQWKDNRFDWENPEFGSLPLTFPKSPDPDQFTEIVRCVGRAAKDADRVQVSFDCVAPSDEQWWTGDSSEGLDVPLGRAGAMKLQSLRLGRGTSQHVLIAGKTGSGKSTLLHALVTNVSIRYSPDEVALYLIDFKKGVEFKAYANTELPHARVVAIESEREFGLSVLERLDLELKERGDMYRAAGVQDLAGFRAARPDVKLPRLLLIVDEFQELFIEDDRISQNASLLLDRLVRQGRAFGIHVLLGSQTLAGSFSLPRSTIGQMAVRIALQCSDADAHLILSEENTAARLLGRPGEAIYNDANGLFEGNHPFQVVWLSDDERESYLQRVQQFARQRQFPIQPAIVFEGNASADVAKNNELAAAIAAPNWPERAPMTRAWLGSAVAIKEPTSVDFGRQTGNNLLVIGHQEEESLGVLAACFTSLAAQHAPGKARFIVLDGARIDSPAAGFWPKLGETFANGTSVTGPRGTPDAIAEVAAELERREQTADETGPPWYVFVYDLARFRDLRRSEDDFSFSRMDDEKKANPAAQFAKILREGPPLGIHAIIWCDTYGNVTRTFERPVLREIELRVLFQMNVTDSSNLIDSPAASQLGVHRALLYNEGNGRIEKFRPYGIPPGEWIAEVVESLEKKQ